MGYSRRRRRTGPPWGLLLSIAVLAGGAAYFGPQYLAPRLAPPPPPDIAPAAALSPSPSPSPAAQLAEGDALMEAGRWGAAAAVYADIARTRPNEAAAYAQWARALVYANKPAEAVERAQKATELEPRVAEYQAILALAHDWSGNPDRAITAARRAIELDPKLPEAHAYLAEALTDKYRLREAEEALDRATAAGGADNPTVLRVQAYLQETKADYASAVATYKRAIERAPNRSYLYLSLGHALRAQKQYDDAIQAFQRAADLNPQDARAEGGMGLVYFALEEYDSAKSHLERSVEIDPNYATGYGQLGWVHYVKKEYEAAQPLFEKAVDLEKDAAKNATYRHALGWIYLNTKQYDKARNEFTKVLEESPDLEGAKEGLQMLDKLQGAPAAKP